MKALFAAIFTISLSAQELPFLEKFANPSSRDVSLAELTPRTRDWFYYHALHQQLQGDEAAFTATMQQWKQLSENPKESISSKGYSILENRQLLLRSQTKPDEVAAELAKKLDLSFDYEKFSVIDARNAPSTLNPQLISPAAFESELQKTSPTETWKHYSAQRLQVELENVKNFTNEKRLSIVLSLKTANTANALECIAMCLEENRNHEFGSAPVHQTLVHSQLKSLLLRIPKLSTNQEFSRRYLQTMRPSDESNYLQNPELYLAHMQACDSYLRDLPPIFNNWKADCLWQKLLLQLQTAQLNRDDLLRYLALPIQGCALIETARDQNQNSTPFAQSHFDVISGDLRGTTNELELMLLHFLADTEDVSDFARYIPKSTLTKLHAKAHLLQGDLETKWTSSLNADEFRELRDSSQLTFSPEQPRSFTPQDEVILLLDCKNTPQITLRIFELDLVRYLRNNSGDPDASLSLDGLVPHTERTLSFNQAAIIRHRQNIPVPELKGRGAWIVECVSGGIASRALIRKGNIIPFIEKTDQGQRIRLFDEAQQLIPSFQVHTNKETLRSQEDGTLLIPYTLKLSLPQQAIIEASTENGQGPTLAKHLPLDSTQVSYELYCGFHLDREQLISDQKTKLFLQPQLLNHDQLASLDVIKNATLTVTATLLSGATSDHVIAPLQLNNQFTVEFNMPPDATHLSIKLEAEIPRPNDLPPFKLRATKSYEFNEALATAKIYSCFFTHTNKGHRLEILGRNGEPAPQWQVPVLFHHRHYDTPLSITLQTNDEGIIELGELKDIDSVSLNSSDLAASVYKPYGLDAISFVDTIHQNSDQIIRIPLAKTTERSGISLIETTNNKSSNQNAIDLPTRDASDRVHLEENQLVIDPLAAGNYQLTLADQIITLRISAAKPTPTLLASAQRILQKTTEPVCQIASTEVNADQVSIRLKEASPYTRVSIVASQFSAQQPLSEAFATLPNRTPAYKILGLHESSFLNNRALGDETRYVFERRTHKKFPGNMLPLPGLLVNRYRDDYDGGSYGASLLPNDGKLDKKSESDSTKEATITRKKSERNSHGPLYDFLAHGSTVLYDLKPNAEGVVTLSRKDFPDARSLTVIATEGQHYHQTSVPLDPNPLKKRARELTRALDPEKHFIGTQRAIVLQTGQSESINNILDARWKEYATIHDVYRMFLTRETTSLMVFSFLPKWNTLAEARKLELYNAHACHEFNVFLWRKDRAFFDAFVKPQIAQKRELDFLDHFLLGHDMRGYLNQKEWRKLNAAERALLCQALPTEAQRIRKELQFEQLEFQLPTALQAQIFTQTLEGSELSLKERAELSSLLSRDEEQEQQLTKETIAELRSIIIPSVNFQDTSIGEAIDFLRPYAPGINLLIEENQSMLSSLDVDLQTFKITDLRVVELKMTNVSLPIVLKYLCESTRLRYQVGGRTITLKASSDDGEDTITKSFQVPPDFLDALQDSPADESSDPFAIPADKSTGPLPRRSVKDLLKSKGVPFPDGSSATFVASNSTLLVRNTPTNLDLVEQICAACACDAPAPVPHFEAAKGLQSADKEVVWSDDSNTDVSDPFASADAQPFGESNRKALPEVDAFATPVFDDPHTQKSKTRVFEERQYWRNGFYYGVADTVELIPVNRFWVDLANWNGKGAFLSTFFNECTRNDNEMLMALALLDLPFTKEEAEITQDQQSLTWKAKQPMMLFYRDTRETNTIVENSPILVRQTFYPHNYRYRFENGRDIENIIDDGKFTVGEAYGTTLIIANPTGETRHVHVLCQIPAGAVPLEGQATTESMSLDLQPYGNEQVHLSFYFPQQGEFRCYPFHVSENDSVLAYPKAITMHVTTQPDASQNDNFALLADDGDEKKLLDFIRSMSLFDKEIDFSDLGWRLKDRKFYDQLIAILNDRLYFSPIVHSFAFYHNDTPEIRRYLENSSTIKAVGPWLETPFLTVTATQDLSWFDREYDPFINPRAHRLGKQDQLPLESAKEHYIKLLDIFCHKTKLSADDHMQRCYFLLLQNRVEEAIDAFQLIEGAALPQQLHYDYLHCYILFAQAKPNEAKTIAQRYQNHPLSLWKNRFHAIIAQADELDAPVITEAEAKDPAKKSAVSYVNMAHKDDGKLWLTHQGLKATKIQLYQVDMELLFTANPFLDGKKVLHHAIRPNKVIDVVLEGKETTVDLPADYAQGNVIAAVDAGTHQVLQSINSSKIAMIIQKDRGELQVIERSSNKRQAGTYYKIYARMKDDSVQFYKDGYTDLRGKCNYYDHSTIEPDSVIDFAIFLQHPTLGTRVETVTGALR